MAVRTARAQKNLLTMLGGVTLRWSSRFLLPSDPLIKIGLTLRDDHKAHVSVLKPAVFSTFAAIRACLIRLNDDGVDPARNKVHLAMKLRNPETVNYVTRFQYHLDWDADWDVDLIC